MGKTSWHARRKSLNSKALAAQAHLKTLKTVWTEALVGSSVGQQGRPQMQPAQASWPCHVFGGKGAVGPENIPRSRAGEGIDNGTPSRPSTRYWPLGKEDERPELSNGARQLFGVPGWLGPPHFQRVS
jgi:hypothetical protein